MSRRCACHGFEVCFAKPLAADFVPSGRIQRPWPLSGNMGHDPIIEDDANIKAEDTKAKIKRAAHVQDILDDVKTELTKAMAAFPPFNSAHEGFAVIQEEFNTELWEEVCAKQGARDVERMRKEAVQCAAMCVRFIHDVCDKGRGQK